MEESLAWFRTKRRRVENEREVATALPFDRLPSLPSPMWPAHVSSLRSVARKEGGRVIGKPADGRRLRFAFFSYRWTVGGGGGALRRIRAPSVQSSPITAVTPPPELPFNPFLDRRKQHRGKQIPSKTFVPSPSVRVEEKQRLLERILRSALFLDRSPPLDFSYSTKFFVY